MAKIVRATLFVALLRLFGVGASRLYIEYSFDGFMMERSARNPQTRPVVHGTVTVLLVEALVPSSSVTVSLTVCVPAAGNRWYLMIPVPVVPSPKFHT